MFAAGVLAQPPPRLNIYHFDVNTGDATLILTPDGHGILIDAGDTGRGKNPITEFLNRARQDGRLTSLDYTIVTHYDADHIGGMDEVMNAGWYPESAALDRGDSFLPPFERKYVETHCTTIDPGEAQSLVMWGSAPKDSCRKGASCAIIQYLSAAAAGGKRKTIEPGDVLEFDNGVRLTALVVNAKDIDGDTVEVYFPGRRKDCAANDLSVGMLLEYGRFRYLIAGDLTGVPKQDVANVEVLIQDDAQDVDVYRINHHGSETSSSRDFIRAMAPTVVIVSNGTRFSHPRDTVIRSILDLHPKTVVYLTNRTDGHLAWNAPADQMADRNNHGFDGTVEIAVWRQTYRVYRWRDGDRIDGGDQYQIKNR